MILSKKYSELLSEIMNDWGISEFEVLQQFHKDSPRLIFQIRTGERSFILKGIPDEMSEDFISGNVSAHLYLGNHLHLAPEVYPSLSGEYYIHHGGFWFYLMEYIKGRQMLDTPEDEYLLGKLSRRIHALTDYEVDSPLSQTTDRFYEWFKDRPFKTEFDAILDSLPDFRKLPQCFIHSDIGPHNAMIRESGEAVFIDLDDTGKGSRYMDLGWPFIMQFVDFDHSNGHMTYQWEAAVAFLRGYYEEPELSQGIDFDYDSNHDSDAGIVFDREEYDRLWQGAMIMHIGYMQVYGPEAVNDLWRILNFGMEQKETLWEKVKDLARPEKYYFRELTEMPIASDPG